MEFNNIGMAEFVEENNFAVGPLGVGGMLEGVEYFFQSKDFACPFICDFPDMAIGSAADLF